MGPLLALCSLTATIAWCQKPVIFPGGIVNAASYQAANTSSQDGVGLLGTSLVSIFGQNLADCTRSAAATPLPTEICGTSVTMGGIAAPLLYVSPGQINLQLPSFTQQGLVVATGEGSSDPYLFGPAFDTDVSFGVFTQDSSGRGQGAVLNNGTDGSLSVNSPANSASPGDYISVFGTGLFIPGYTPGFPPLGSPSPFSPLVAAPGAGALLDFQPSGSNPCPYCWAGLAPGFVGVDQINMRLPDTVREGCAVPLQIFPSSTMVSQPVTISIHKGGGQCVDPPSAGDGQVVWERPLPPPLPAAPARVTRLLFLCKLRPGGSSRLRRQAPARLSTSTSVPPAGFPDTAAWMQARSCLKVQASRQLRPP